MFQIDYSKINQKPKMYLCKPDKTIIGKLNEAFNIVLNLKLGQVNELNFSLPYTIDINHKLERNVNIDKVKHRYLIKFVLHNYTEWFIINIPTDTMSDEEDIKNIQCYSLLYELRDKIIRGYKEDSKNATQALTVALENTIWTIDYVDPDFDIKYRSFDISSKTRLDFVYEIANTFGALVICDTENRKINLYNPDNIGLDNGLSIKYGKYLQGMEYKINPDFCTRLKIYGKDNLSIHEVNVVGSNYIDDFSYFLYPFERDINKNVLKRSDYMSDGLCNALLDYYDILESKNNDFGNLLTQLEGLQTSLTTKENEMSTLSEQMAVILDQIDIVQSSEQPIGDLFTQRDNKQAEIDAKQLEIDNINISIIDINNQISTLRTEISIENNLTQEQIIELNKFIIEREISNENIDNAKDLLEWGKKEFEKIKTPQILIDINIINLFDCIDYGCQVDRDKLSLGDIINIKHDKFNVNVKAKIIEINYDFENGDISVVISNIEEINKDKEEFLKKINKAIDSSTTIDINKYMWNKTGNNESEIYRIIDILQGNVKEELDLAVNETVTLNRRGLTITDINDPLKFLRATNCTLGITNDGGNTFKNAVTYKGLVGDQVYGKLLCGVNLQIDASNTEGEKIFSVNETGVNIEGLALTITNGLPENQINSESVEKWNSALGDAVDYVDQQISDVNTSLNSLQGQIDDFSDDLKLTLSEANTLENSLIQLKKESLDLINVATSLNITTEKVNYSDALLTLETELNNWINQTNYPLDITSTDRTNINNKLSNVQNYKSILINKINSITDSNTRNYINAQVDEVNESISSLESSINQFSSDEKITLAESNTLKLSLQQVKKESLDLINIAASLNIVIEKNNYVNSLSTLELEVNKWINKEDYPIDITVVDRNNIINKIGDVQDKKSILINKISIVREQSAINYIDNKIEDIIDIDAPNINNATVTVFANNDGSITVLWNGFIDDQSGIKGYNIWRSLTNNASESILIVTLNNSNVNNYLDINTIHNTPYYYWVSAYDNAGNESTKVQANSISVKAFDSVLPLKPTNLNIVGGWGRIDLSWDAPAGKDILKYKIEISDNADFTNTTTKYSFSPSFTDFNRNNTNTRHYRIYSVDKVGNISSEYLSGIGNATLASDNIKPNAPTRPEQNDIISDNNGRLTISFIGSTSTDASNYRIVRYTIDNPNIGTDVSTIRHLGVINHTFTDVYLEKDKEYFYQIYTIDNSGNLSENSLRIPSNGGKYAVDNIAPNVPVIDFIQGKIGAIAIKWSAVPNAVSYNVYRYDPLNEAEGFVFIGKTSQLQFTDNTMSVNEQLTYHYKVSALDSWDNESNMSNAEMQTSLTPFTANDTSPPTMGTFQIASENDNGSITISWSGFSDIESGIAGFNIWRIEEQKGIYNFNDKLLIKSINSKNINSYVDKDIISGTSYKYYVTCFDNAGNETILSDNLTQWVSATSLDKIDPQAPSQIVVAGGLGIINISWNPPPDDDIKNYIIQIGNDINDFNPPAEEYKVLIPLYSDFGRDSMNRRYYRIYSEDFAGNISSEYLAGDGIPSIPGTGEAPNKPNKPTVKSNYDGSITISWTHNNPSTDISKYRIFRRNENDSKYKDVSAYGSTDGYGEAGYAESYMISLGEVDSNTIEYTDTGLQNGQEYRYSIASVSFTGLRSERSEDSDIVSATDHKSPDISNLNLITTSRAGSILLEWNESPNERGEIYEIWRSSELNNGYSKIVTIAGSNNNDVNINSYSDNSMEVGEEVVYYYKIRAIDSWGNISNFCEPVMGKSSGFTGLADGYNILDFVNTIYPNEKEELSESIINLNENLNLYLSDNVITQLESQQLKLSLAQVLKESEDIINIAISLDIITESTNYNNALIALETELSKWINKTTYPLDITTTDRTNIQTKFETVQNTKSVLINKITSAREQNAKTYANTILSNFVANVYNIAIEDLQSQIDGNITTWFYNYEPTLSNLPASDWITEIDKNNHLGDLFYDNTTGYAYRFALINSVYQWVRIVDTDVVTALANAALAQDTADAKRRVFVSQPIPPYDVGDLWRIENDANLKICIVAKIKDQLYSASDWVYATNSLGEGKLYNGVKIDTTNGLVITRSDNKVKSLFNATDGIAIQKNIGTTDLPNWVNKFYVDTGGTLNAEDLIAKKLKITNGSNEAIIDASTGTIDFSKFTTKLGKITVDNLDLYNLNIINNNGETTLSIDSSGNVALSGNITMKGGSISWDNLPDGVASTGQIPTSPEDIGALPASDLPSYITKTKITQTTIESPDIRGGTITSDTTIDVGTDLKVGNNVYLGKYVQSEDKHIYLKDNCYLYTIGDSLGITAMGNIIINPAFGVYIGNSNSPDNEVATKGDIRNPVAVFG